MFAGSKTLFPLIHINLVGDSYRIGPADVEEELGASISFEKRIALESVSEPPLVCLIRNEFFEVRWSRIKTPSSNIPHFVKIFAIAPSFRFGRNLFLFEPIQHQG